MKTKEPSERQSPFERFQRLIRGLAAVPRRNARTPDSPALPSPLSFLSGDLRYFFLAD